MKALVVAGGIPQIELIRQLKGRNIYTVLADGSANAVAKSYADEFYQVDIFDIDAVTNIAKNEEVDFVITVCADQVLLVVAEVSERLGLPCYIDAETARDVSDKIRMKKIFKKHGVPTSEYVETTYFDLHAISHLKYPLVVKPVDAYSSKGVRKAYNEIELEAFYDEASQLSRSGRVIVEEFFQGDEISVDAFVVNGKAKVLAVTNSDKIKEDNRFIIFRGRYPASITETVLKKINDIAQKIADGFGLVNAPLLIQLLLNEENVSVLEFCARTGGNMKWLLIKHSCGVDVITATIDITLGVKPDLTLVDTGHKIVVNDFIYCNEGIFDHFEGIDEMVEKGIINEFYQVRLKGTQMQRATSSSDRIAGINIIADSVEDFNQKQNRIAQSIRVLDNKGKDIMRRDLFTDL